MRIRWVAPLAVCIGIGAAGSAMALPANERRMNGWWHMEVSIAGDYVVYARSTLNTVRPGGYTVYRTDTFRAPIRHTAFNGRRLLGVILRTSAGRTTGGLLTSDGAGQHVLAATGRNFRPQVTYCCLTNEHDTPVQADSRGRGPVTIAVGLQGETARMVQRDNLGRIHLVDQGVGRDPYNPLGPRRDVIIDAAPLGRLVSMAPGMLAWIDVRGGRVRVAGAPVGADPVPLADVPAPAGSRAIALTERMLAVAAYDTTRRRHSVVRYDAPDWQPVEVWSGTHAPRIAAGDRTIAITAGRSVLQQVTGQQVRRVALLRSAAYGLATDGMRIVTLERINPRVGKRRVRQTAMRVFPVRDVPPMYGPRIQP